MALKPNSAMQLETTKTCMHEEKSAVFYFPVQPDVYLNDNPCTFEQTSGCQKKSINRFRRKYVTYIDVQCLPLLDTVQESRCLVCSRGGNNPQATKTWPVSGISLPFAFCIGCLIDFGICKCCCLAVSSFTHELKSDDHIPYSLTGLALMQANLFLGAWSDSISF